jgi:hypothetical protein
MSAERESAGGVRTQAALMIVVVFLVGAFAGGAFERMSHRGTRGGPPGGRMWGGGRGGPGGPGGPMGSGRDSTRLPPGYDQLGLSDAQRLRLDSAFARRRPRIDSLMKSTWAMVQPAMDSTRDEVNAILTPDQRTKLDSLRRSSRGRGGRGRNPGNGDSAAAGSKTAKRESDRRP